VAERQKGEREVERHVEDESSKGFATRLWCLVDYKVYFLLRRLVDNAVVADFLRKTKNDLKFLLRKLKNALKFLLFMEEEPEHRVVYDLQPIHALLTLYFCLLAPSLIFLWLMPMGFLTMCAGEMLLVLAVLEVLHITYDRPQNP
jgi:hypothetical protein